MCVCAQEKNDSVLKLLSLSSQVYKQSEFITTFPIATTFDLPVHAHHHCVVPLVGLQSDLLLRLQLVGLQLLDLLGKDLGGLSSGVDAIGLQAGRKEKDRSM